MSRQDSKQIENVKVMLLKGENGSSMVNIEKTGTQGLVDTYTITMDDGSKFTFNVSNGKEITSVVKTGTQGLVDTYTMTFNDNSTETFTVTNGNGIASIEKTGTNVLVDTYTITMDNGSTATFTVTNGNGIESIQKTGTQGAVDTYTITLTNGTTSTFTVTNATGIIDENFSETSENAIQTATVSNVLASVENSEESPTTYEIGQFILRANHIYKVTASIAVGDTFVEDTNIEQTNIGELITQILSSLDRSFIQSPDTLHRLQLEDSGMVNLWQKSSDQWGVVGQLLKNAYLGSNINIDSFVEIGWFWLNAYNSTVTGTFPNFVTKLQHHIFYSNGGTKQILIPANSQQGIWVRLRDSTSGTWGAWFDATAKSNDSLWTGSITHGGSLSIPSLQTNSSKYRALLFKFYNPTNNAYAYVEMPMEAFSYTNFCACFGMSIGTGQRLCLVTFIPWNLLSSCQIGIIQSDGGSHTTAVNLIEVLGIPK